ncbi:MAG TPA: hypothetical protein VGH44_04200 [Candidatus Saccharimonadia bacterium]|jgi:hypothetical protein
MATLTNPGDLQGDERVSDGQVSDAEFDQIEAYANDPTNASSAQAGNTVENASEGKIKSRPKDDNNQNSSSADASGGTKTAAPTATAGSGPGSSKSGGTTSSSSRLSQFSAGVGRRKKPLTYVIIAVIVSGIMAGGFMSLVPFKLESMMKNILKHRIEARIKHYVVKRIFGPRQLLKSYLKASVGNDDAAFEKEISNFSEPEKQLMRNWRKPPDGGDSLEKQLANQQRLVAKKEGGTIHLYQDNVHIGSIDDPKVVGALGDKFTTQVHNLQYLERNPLRKMATVLYSVKDWKFFSKKTGPDAEKEVTSERIDKAGARFASGLVSAVKCALGAVTGGGADCPTDEGNPNAQDRTGVSDVTADPNGTTHDGDVTSAASDSNTTATQKAKDIYNKVADHVLPGRVFSRLLSKFLAPEITQSITTAFAAAKGPLILVSAIDIASRIDHFFWYGTADKVLVNIHKVQYAGEFFLWGTINDNHNDGNTVSGDEFNATMGMLDGTEKSEASKYIYGTAQIGANTDKCDPSNQSLTCVSDGNGGVTEEVNSRSINETQHPIQDWYRSFITYDPLIGSIGFHYAMELWYHSLGIIWGAINSVIGAIFNLIVDAIKIAIPPLGSAIDWLMAHIGQVLAELLIKLVGPAVDGTETGADLFNQIDAGGTVAGMDFARWMGGHMLSAPQAVQIDQEVATEQGITNRKLSLSDRLFSADNPRSLVNVLALQAPVTPAGALSDGADYMAAIGARPYQMLAPLFQLLGVGSAQATYDDPSRDYGLNEWGYTDQDLSQNDNGAALAKAYQSAQQRLGKLDVKLGEMSLDDCPAVDPPHTPPDQVHANLCRLDLANLQSMNSDFTNADDGGLNSP